MSEPTPRPRLTVIEGARCPPRPLPPRRAGERPAIFPMGARLALAVVIALVALASAAANDGTESSGAIPRRERRWAPIVNGHPVQPAARDLRTPDISGRDAQDVEALYWKLMDQSREHAGDAEPAAGPSR